MLFLFASRYFQTTIAVGAFSGCIIGIKCVNHPWHQPTKLGVKLVIPLISSIAIGLQTPFLLPIFTMMAITNPR